MYIANLEGSITLTKDGRWLRQGELITHERTVQLFHRSIIWDPAESTYFLQIGKGRARFAYEDTAYFIASLETGSTPWRITLLDGSDEPLRYETLRVGARHRLYCLVKQERPALFMRSAYQVIAAHIDEDGLLQTGHDHIRIPYGDR